MCISGGSTMWCFVRNGGFGWVLFNSTDHDLFNSISRNLPWNLIGFFFLKLVLFAFWHLTNEDFIKKILTSSNRSILIKALENIWIKKIRHASHHNIKKITCIQLLFCRGNVSRPSTTFLYRQYRVYPTL